MKEKTNKNNNEQSEKMVAETVNVKEKTDKNNNGKNEQSLFVCLCLMTHQPLWVISV